MGDSIAGAVDSTDPRYIRGQYRKRSAATPPNFDFKEFQGVKRSYVDQMKSFLGGGSDHPEQAVHSDSPISLLDPTLFAALQRIVSTRTSRVQLPLRAVAFILPEVHEKAGDKIESAMRSLSSTHVQFFDIWSEPNRTELVAVAAENVLTHLSEQFRSIFRARPTKFLAGYKEEIVPLPPWIRPGLYFKVLNIREEDPFRGLAKFIETDDPITAMVTTLQALSKNGVNAWVSFGWTEFDWWPWAREYAKAAGQDVFTAIQSEAYQGPFFGEEGARPTTAFREAAGHAEKRAQATRLVASLRIALFAENPEALNSSMMLLQGAIRAFAGVDNALQADDAPFEFSERGLSDERETLMMMAARQLGWEGDMKWLLDRHLSENLARGRFGPLGTPFPGMLITSSELPLFVHLPVWSTERQLTSLRYSKPPTPFLRLPDTPPPGVQWIRIGAAVEADMPEVALDPQEFAIHALFLGRTGTGKSTSIINDLIQLVQESENLPPEKKSTFWIIDPVGALGDYWKKCAPQEVMDRTYYFDPEKTPWGMNMLELPVYKDEKDRNKLVAVKIEAVTRMIKEAAKMISGQAQWGHRLETIIHQSLLGLYYRPATGEIPEPRDVPTFRELFMIVAAIGEEEALEQLAGEMHLPQNIVTLFKDYPKEAKTAVYNKLMHFVEPHTESFTCSTKNNIDFRELDQPGNVIFFDFKHFAVMPTTVATLMGNVIVNIYLAELTHKAKIADRDNAWQTYMVIDEFHRAADLASFHDILATARNMKLSLWLAYQGIEQLTDEALSQTVFNNTHVKFIFSVGGDIAKHVKDQLDISLGKHIAERLQALEMHQCYVSKLGTGLVQTPPPILVRAIPPPPIQRTLEEADAFFAKKMSIFKPPVLERTFIDTSPTQSSTEAEEVFEPFRQTDGKIHLPRPEDFPILWAIRDYYFQTIYHRVQAGRDAQAVTLEPPDFDELTGFINAQPWSTGKYRRRTEILAAIGRLKREGWVREASVGEMGKRVFIISNNPTQQAVVLFNTPAPGGNQGGREHLESTREFMENTVRKYMPNWLPLIPSEAINHPDGVMVASQSIDRWNMRQPIAVECHMPHVVRGHTTRVTEQIKKRFAQGYAGVMVVCTRAEDERKVRQEIEKDPELQQKVNNTLIEIYTYVRQKLPEEGAS